MKWVFGEVYLQFKSLCYRQVDTCVCLCFAADSSLFEKPSGVIIVSDFAQAEVTSIGTIIINDEVLVSILALVLLTRIFPRSFVPARWKL